MLTSSFPAAWMCVCAKLPQSCLTLCDPVDCSYQAPPSMGFSRQEYWKGLPFPSPGDLPNPGIEPAALMPPASADGFFTTSAPPPGKPSYSPSRNLTQEEQVEDPPTSLCMGKPGVRSEKNFV